MPKENRKRGKKHKKTPQEQPDVDAPAHRLRQPEKSFGEEEAAGPGPSWIKNADAATNAAGAGADDGAADPEAPFGYVDADVKAYFRTVDVQIREWAADAGRPAVEATADEDGEQDPNEDRRMFFVAALQEMGGKERQLATDPDCSGVLERMAHSMDDFVRRVFVDALAGSYERLVRHRFASHVCQTLFTVARDTISRECRGVLPDVPDTPGAGELRTLGQLVEDVCDELLPTLTSLIMDPFASHVLRALLLLLSPSLSASASSASGGQGGLHSALRSKKSAAWKARQGPMRSVFTEKTGAGTVREAGTGGVRVPDTFSATARRFVDALRNELGENEVRALAADKVASPVLQLLLELEAEHGIADEPDSLMDRVLVGLITSVHATPPTNPPASDYLSTLLRDPTSSHLLETLATRCPPRAFSALYATYFRAQLPRLAVHPVANFVVARVLARAPADAFGGAVEELAPLLGKVVKANRTGVVRAMVERAAALGAHEQAVVEAICSAFSIDSDTPEERHLFVPCVLRLLTRQEYASALGATDPNAAEDSGKGPAGGRRRREDHRKAANANPLEPKTQGSILLQSLIQLPEPHNQIIIDSIQSMSPEDLLALSRDATASRVLDAYLDSPAVPRPAKRKLVLAFLGHFHTLVDDRIGSRVGDRLWAASDPYLKEKIGRSLVPQEHVLLASFYGKFFVRNLNLHLLRRNPEEWKTLQAEASKPAPAVEPISSPVRAEAVQKPRKEKRKRKAEDEIDALFEATLGKRTRKGALGDDLAAPAEPAKKQKAAQDDPSGIEDATLKDVLGAIKAAPKGDAGSRGSKARRKGR